jgi:gliding motility-associated-like protein
MFNSSTIPAYLQTALMLLLVWVTGRANAQKCTAAGQTPETAIPVCAQTVFVQSAAPVCSNGRLNIPGCSSNADNSPYWYTFTCHAAGTLGFVITPANPNYEDYDWQLFDVTNKQPGDVFTDTAMFVSGNWSGGYAPTGTSSTQTRNMACGSGPDAPTTFNKMPNLIVNHVYLLLVSRANPASAYGFTLAFGGGTAVITDAAQAPPVPAKATASCNGNSITVTFSKNILCSSVAANGSDFALPATTLATITSASPGQCNNGVTNTVVLTLSNTLSPGGYRVQVQQINDGNTLLDECHNQSPQGSYAVFSVAQRISATFTLGIQTGCTGADTLTATSTATAGVTSWRWTFSDSVTDTLPIITRLYSLPGTQTLQLIASSGTCADTVLQQFTIAAKLNAAFTTPTQLCPGQPAQFTNTSTGNAASWLWQFGNGNSSVVKNPPAQTYPVTVNDTVYNAMLTVQNAKCTSTAYQTIYALAQCPIAVATAFTPNGDNINDFLYPLNAYNATRLLFRVYNRWGQKVFEGTSMQQKWDGRFNATPQPPGVYLWQLSYTSGTAGKRIVQQGSTVLIR